MYTQYDRDFAEFFKFVIVFVLFILSWISVAVVGRAIDNFTFTTLKLNDKSTYQTTIIALTIIAIEVLIIFYLKSFDINVYDTSVWHSHNENVVNSTNSTFSIDRIANINQITII